MEYPGYILQDLLKSGLIPDDMQIRILDNAERAITVTPHSVSGYVLPYFESRGKMLPFYRVRLFEADSKYRQPKDSPNHVYFPKGFWDVLGGKKYVILCEGEKRAACACKAGFPAVAFGSVDAWKNRTITVSGDAALSQANKRLAIRIPSGDEVIEDYNAPLAAGFLELIDLIKEKNLYVIIVYDTDNITGRCTSLNQRAAALLGYELRFRGIDFFKIRQMLLPTMVDFEYTGDKVGLDDFLVSKGPNAFREQLVGVLAARGAFPKHPNVRDYINKRLQKSKMTRKEMQEVSLATLSDLDSHGLRLRSPSGETFYFDQTSRKLLMAAWPNGRDELYDAPFTQFLYKEYGLSAADNRLLIWLGTQFSSEEPIESVTPHKIYARPNVDADEVIFQISDSEFVKLTKDGLEVHDNGDYNILFEADQVDPLDRKKLIEQFERQANQKPECWWASTLSEVRLRDKDKQRIVAALLYYMSPWLFRWRGMQLPVELIIGESGSGKSTLCELRLDILTGRPLLRNTPTDLKDWHASVTNSGGLHVTDNVQLVDRTMRQRLSDEICRITTEPEPFIEQRKYYTNAEQVRIPVRAVFALTAIQQPFQNADLLQRAIILELDKSIDANETGLIRYDSNWKAKQLSRFGGRESWIAHHLVVLQRFFKLVDQKWNNNYSAKHRLINFEQSVLLMAEVFGLESGWIPDFLVNATDKAVSEADWILEGLHAFALEHNRPNLKGKRFRASVISEWSESQHDYKDCEMLVNSRKLGKYLRAHKSAIYHLTGMVEAGMEGNRICYRFDGKTLERR